MKRVVSDKVRVVSKNCEDEQYIWESAAGDLSPCRMTPRWYTGELSATRRSLHLKDDQSEFFAERRLKDLVQKLPEFIGAVEVGGLYSVSALSQAVVSWVPKMTAPG